MKTTTTSNKNKSASKKQGNINLLVNNSAAAQICPSTPPPSPSIEKQDGSFLFGNKTGSMNSLLNLDHLDADYDEEQQQQQQWEEEAAAGNLSFSIMDPIEMRKIHNSKNQRRERKAAAAAAKTQQKKQIKMKNNICQRSNDAAALNAETETQCIACQNEASPLVKINLFLVDEKHSDFFSKFKRVNRFLNIKFSSLRLNVNPETWIILLDLLGLGSRIYPTSSSSSSSAKESSAERVQGTTTKSTRQIRQQNYSSHIQALIDEKKSTTGIKFQVKQFVIQLNQTNTATNSGSCNSSEVARFKVNDVRAFIESRPESMQVNFCLTFAPTIRFIVSFSFQNRSDL